MKCELRIVSGAREGHRDVFDKSYIGIGRHPLSDVRFDAEHDLDASTRHAAIVRNGETWLLRDLGSTNGTYLNGEKLTADRPLKDGDTMKFGVHGPEVSFHVIHEAGDADEVIMPAVQAPKVSATKPEGMPAAATAAKGPESDTAPAMKRPARAGGSPPSPPSPPSPSPPPSKTSVLRAEISNQKARSRALAIALFVLIIGALGVVYWQGKKGQEDIGAVRTVADSLRGVIAQLQVARAQADSEKNAAETALRAEQDPGRRQQLTARIQRAEQRTAAIQVAQGVDYRAIENANTRATALIAVRFPDTTRMWEGTAFSVNAQGLMLTNKHLVQYEGQAPRDIAVRFHGSRDVLPARLVRVAPDADIAVIQVESPGPFPVIAGFNEGAAVAGAPVALIGFPGGCGACPVPRAKTVSGSITAASDSLLELDAFSGIGASGSPIFDRDGKVIGIEFGGRGGASSTEIVGLPIRRALALIR